MGIGWIILSGTMLEKLVMSPLDISAGSIPAPDIDRITYSFLVVKAFRIEPYNQCVVCGGVIGSTLIYRGSIPFYDCWERD